MALSRGNATLLGACAAGVAMPLGAFVVGLPLWIDGPISAGVGLGLFFLLRSGKQPSLDEQVLNDARAQTGRSLLPDALDALDRMKQAMGRIKDPAVRGQVADLITKGRKVVDQVRADPGRAMAVRRLLTFYLPNAASLAEGWVALEGRALPSPERMTQTGDTLRALNQAFAKFADDMAEPQMQTLDVDLKVVNDALKSDLEKTA
ncbi:MAG TPA: 5-bromo-4-chloroindolyl phosphate hydrolysis family protein [Caulobacteraceae bacterium]|jgi:5-bromo-4-chloroindolyl phosphate hydrolysis protein|nr:5-bromo-4-chloroindolyl phosphate hydrolysis family protein [Caulobacteraceae bacterium]